VDTPPAPRSRRIKPRRMSTIRPHDPT